MCHLAATRDLLDYTVEKWDKTIKLAVKRHINKFPERFMFQLTEKELECLRFQVETTNNSFVINKIDEIEVLNKIYVRAD